MHDNAVVLSPHSGIIAATAPQPRASLPLVRLPPENRRGGTSSPSPSWLRVRPGIWGVTPLPIAVDPGRLPNDGANVLLKSLRLA